MWRRVDLYLGRHSGSCETPCVVGILAARARSLGNHGGQRRDGDDGTQRSGYPPGSWIRLPRGKRDVVCPSGCGRSFGGGQSTRAIDRSGREAHGGGHARSGEEDKREPKGSRRVHGRSVVLAVPTREPPRRVGSELARNSRAERPTSGLVVLVGAVGPKAPPAPRLLGAWCPTRRRDAVATWSIAGQPGCELTIDISSGPVVSGVIGTRRSNDARAEPSVLSEARGRSTR